MWVVWVSAKDQSELQSASSPLDGLQAKKWGICRWLCNQSTHSSPEMWIWRECIGGKDHWTHDCIYTNRSIPAWTAGKSQRLQADSRTCRGETFWSHSRRLTGNSETHKHTTEQCGPSRPSMRQLWQSPSPKSMSGIQRLGHWKKFCRNRKGTNRPKEDDKQRGDTKSDGKQHKDAGKGSRRRDRRFHDLEPAASYTSEEGACARSNSRSILELRETHSHLGHTSRCTRHSPQKTSLSPQGTSSWLPTTVRRSTV